MSENSGEKKQYRESVIGEMQNSMEQNNVRTFYEIFNGVQRRIAPSPVILNYRKDTMLATRMKEHFEILLKGENASAATNRLSATETMDKR